MKIVISFLIMIFISNSCSFAGERTDTADQKKLKIIPFPNLGYSPETGFYFGGVALFTFRTSDQPFIRLSKVKPEINYTLKNQLIVTLEHEIYTNKNSWYFSGYNAYLKYPESFWGVGNDMPKEQEEIFTSRNLIFKNYFLRSVIPDLYAGIIFHIHSQFDVETEEAGLFSEQEYIGATGGISAGAGVTVLNDKRDNLFTPTKGYFLKISGLLYNNALASDFEFSSVEWDARKYFRLFNGKEFAGQPAVLALQIFGKSNTDGAPFNQLALLGGDSHMRGYYTGRYRDSHYLSLQAEYRMMVWKFLGFAIFAGAGDVAGSYKEFDLDLIKYSLGTGLRIRVDKEENINLRFDYAVGIDGNSGFYVTFGEAF